MALEIGDLIIVTEFQPMSSMAEYTNRKGVVISVRVRGGLSDAVLVKFNEGDERCIGSAYLKRVKKEAK